MSFPTDVHRRSASALFAALLTAGLALGAPAQAEEEAHMAAKEDFRNLCASCHGLEGTGDGQLAELLKVPPPNLTLVARRNGGTFPADAVFETIKGPDMPQAHGLPEMPVWGQWFLQKEAAERLVTGDQTPAIEKATERIRALVAYLQSIQQ